MKKADSSVQIRKYKKERRMLNMARFLAWSCLLLSLALILDTLLPLQTEEEPLVLNEVAYDYGNGRIVRNSQLAITPSRTFVLPDEMHKLPQGSLLHLRTSAVFDQTIQMQAADGEWIPIAKNLHSLWLAYFSLFPSSLALLVVAKIYRQRMEIVMAGTVLCVLNLSVFLALWAFNHF